MKKIAVSNAGAEEAAQMVRTVITREDTRAEADTLFGNDAKEMRKRDRGILHKLFVQAPASVTMAPNLQKSASASPFSFMKTAMMGATPCGPGGDDAWLNQFEGSPLMEQAIHLEEESLKFQEADMQQRLQSDVQYQQQDAERKAHWQKNDQLQLQKKVLALELAKQKAGIGAAPQEQEMAPEEAMPNEEAAPVAPPQEPSPQPQKTASVSARVDAFFEKKAYLSEAQRRYPELLKVADSGTKKVPNLKPRVTTDTSGATPTRAGISGGSA